MSEFHSAVQTLLHTFTSGITIIKTQRSNRRKEKVTLDPSRKAAESDLACSLKRNRREVKTAYEKDASVVGSGFSVGDEEAHSSLASILLRLNAGFVSLIERFTKGRSSHTDYRALINLSNSSRLEAMRTFEMLSRRISQSSLALEAQPGRPKRKRRSGGGSGSGNGKKGGGSKSAHSLTVTPLGVASAEGWVRRKRSSDEGRGVRESKRGSGRETGHNTPKVLASPTSTPVSTSQARSLPPQPKSIHLSPPAYQRTIPTNVNQAQSKAETRNRKSIMSFASDSTKLGEIPEYKWMRPAMFESVGENREVQFPVTTFYPMEPWQEPEKRRGRLRKLFRL